NHDESVEVVLTLRLVFFFSSRRRHTRCLSDWSSDVCSSDLAPPSSVPSSRPTLARSRPRSATWSRSITTRASGRSIFKSVSTYRNLPLCQPAPITAPAVWSICSGGLSLPRISSTSYWPGEGSGGSRRGNTCSPGTCDTAPYTWPYICSVVRLRSFQFFATMPPNPPQLAVSDHMNFASGKAVTALTTWREALLVASSDASGDA